MPTVKINGTKINYMQLGSGPGADREDLVMVHGLAASMAFWYYHHVPEFAERFRITLYDLRGHGRSGMPPGGYSAHNMAMDLRQLLDHLKIDRAHFVAHSFGGTVALHLACMEPRKFESLLLLDTHISAVRGLAGITKWEFGEKVQEIFDRNNLEIDIRDPFFGYRLLTKIAQLRLGGGKIPDELKKLVGPFVLGRNSLRAARQWLRLMDTTRAAEELMVDDGLSIQRFEKFDIPIMAVYGERSQAMMTGEYLLRVWPGAFFRRIRNAGHFFPVTHPSDFIRVCRQFWDGSIQSEKPHRDGEPRRRHFRSDRFFREGDGWFFHTRESVPRGPFPHFKFAREGLQAYIATSVLLRDRFAVKVL
ncbi:MAG: alpha/beta hydrolase [Deltaproteobacteria bacterium]|nr:alpha/beta hydrolase [Deltaproteobacteria bacterium]